MKLQAPRSNHSQIKKLSDLPTLPHQFLLLTSLSITEIHQSFSRNKGRTLFVFKIFVIL